jgi:hypothetical protein
MILGFVHVSNRFICYFIIKLMIFCLHMLKVLIMYSYLMLLIKVLQYILGLLDKSLCALTAHMSYTQCKLCRQICHTKCPTIYTVQKGAVSLPQRLRAYLFLLIVSIFFYHVDDRALDVAKLM